MSDITALTSRPEVLEFLLSRRSRPAKTLTAPAPDRATVETLLTAAARSPDHGKLVPWRFMVLENAACQRLADLALALGPDAGIAPEKLVKSSRGLAGAPLIVAVICSPVASEKIPEVEQVLSTGAVCLSLVNAALASGWGADWQSGWMATNRDFLTQGLSLAEHEFVAGFVHLGRETNVPPERPRPDLSAITDWVSE